ncbi:SRPBCC family protein [Streptomyces sp. NPDC051776]|uniref:SRPBCC family protein n=1 Tax=Streptomyces sp. NPDC051776 TaxID=3155414 RepID=UPI00342CF70C
MPHEIRIVNTVQIRRTPAEVFAYAAAARSWPEWHPTATSVSGEVDRPVEAGDEVIEQDRFAMLKGSIHWRVRHATPALSWTIDGVVHGVPLSEGTTTSVEYVLSAQADGTRLDRTMTYNVPGRALRVLDALYFRRHNARQSERAVRRMKKILES